MGDHESGPIDRFLDAIVGASMGACDVLSPDVILDATVPGWRFEARGEVAVRAEFAGWYADAGTFEEIDRTVLPMGELVTFTLRWTEGGVPHATHQAHVIEVAAGQIARDTVWCGGRWSASLLAEMGEAAHVPA